MYRSESSDQRSLLRLSAHRWDTIICHNGDEKPKTSKRHIPHVVPPFPFPSPIITQGRASQAVRYGQYAVQPVAP